MHILCPLWYVRSVDSWYSLSLSIHSILLFDPTKEWDARPTNQIISSNKYIITLDFKTQFRHSISAKIRSTSHVFLAVPRNRCLCT